jgi:hypothetical protein|tara:strand:+ start:1230 stop:2228 length:999 start_codon:yes stop_codon:yes gene_type:complete
MAFSNTFDTTNTGSGVSNREDLTDVLTILAPEETPILSMANKERASATNVEWTVDSLADPVTTGITEGSDVTAFTDKFASRARLSNRIQKFRRDYMVSDLQEAVDSVGPAKIAQAEAKAIRELKRDIEATVASNNDRATEDGAGTANALRGLGDWLDSAGPSDVPATYRTPAASIEDVGAGPFLESELNSMISSVFTVTGNTNSLMLVADVALRNDISEFARLDAAGAAGANVGVRSVNYDGNSGTIKLSVDLYQSDHGVVSIVNANPDCMPVTAPVNYTGYLLNPEYYGVHELIPMGSTRLPNLGGGDRGFVDCALTLGMYHPGAHGKITS